ncbi:hypothetical protein K502DRAFT_364285 [Neoconidiobolus thromboides FSU 785]|nr:hypothetical protein K502DRAFT_364285 [Neoconidiobolus thromboides FSU 785]
MIFYLLVSLLFYITLAQAHSNLRYPIPRGNTKYSSYCSRGLGCEGPCDSSRSESAFLKPFYPKKVIKRGEKIRVEWLRQNHPGGFIRLAFVPFDQSDDANAFDNNVIKFVCYETNCGETERDGRLGHLNGRGDGLCSTYVTVPDNLPDGPITMQWIWFGGGIFFAVQDTGFANYYNCADMELIGGNEFNATHKYTASFQGGDVANIDTNQCRYWGRNSVHQCPEGSENGDSCGRLNELPNNIISVSSDIEETKARAEKTEVKLKKEFIDEKTNKDKEIDVILIQSAKVEKEVVVGSGCGFDSDNCQEFIYIGQGGFDTKGHKIEHQKLTGANMGLASTYNFILNVQGSVAINWTKSSPVRVF